MNKAHTEPIFEELPKHLREHFRGQMVGNFKAYEGKGGLLDPDVRRRALRAIGKRNEGTVPGDIPDCLTGATGNKGE